jgi:dTDP-4-amino-4,6-dideoxygalactose transaminase
VVTDDARLAETVRSLTDHGRERNRKHRHSLVGTNSRLDGLQAAVLSVKLSRLDEWNRRRRQAMSWYRALLEASPAECVSVDRRADSSCHLNVIRVPKRDAVRSLLVHRGIETGIHYPVPCHLQPAYLGLGSSPLPVAEKAAQEILSLPLSPHITPQQIERVCEVLDEALRASGDRDGG